MMLMSYQLSHYLLRLLSDNRVLLMNAANISKCFVFKGLHESDKLIIHKAALK